VYLYAVANYFRVLTQQRHCDLLNGALFDATNKRFEDARLRLASRYGEKLFPAGMAVGGPIQDAACDPPTLMSYGNHVAQLERQLDASQ